MLRVLTFVLQSMASVPQGSPDLPAFTTIPRCPPNDGGDDVVVCGHVDQDRYRLKPVPQRYQRENGALPKAEVPLVRGTLGVGATQGSVGGLATNRAMATWKLNF